MTSGVEHIDQRLAKIDPSTPVRLLALSDGALDDQIGTLKRASSVALNYKTKLAINAQAIRFFTSQSEPDTRGLSSILQFNNLTKANLVDINGSTDNNTIATLIASLFSDDGCHNGLLLTADKAIMMSSPWQPAKTTVRLTKGENTIWFREHPNQVMINDKIIPVEITDHLTFDNYEAILKAKVDSYAHHLKILKVINNEESKKEIAQIMTYFEDLEKTLSMGEANAQSLLANGSLSGRLEYFRSVAQKRHKSVLMRLAQIANDDRVNQLNSAQQAEYLRTIESSHNAKGLARRAITQGLDFTAVAHKEVKTMNDHIHELNDLDDSDHTKSFYSLETTLGGIRATCQLAKDNLLETLSASDILQMLNLVGLACQAQIGDYPDAMTYRVDKLFSGCHISVSDIIMAYKVSGGQALKVPGTQDEIINVIPFFDDDRIHRFLRKYAPSLLEYTASIGMRRVIAEIPMTYGYTVCAGLWKLIEDIDSNKSDLNCRTLCKMVKTYELAVGGYFDHVMPYLKPQPAGLSYYIANNGVTNMIAPLIHLLRKGPCDFIPEILRALYSYEVWQAVRRRFRHKDNSDLLTLEALDRLVGMDLDTHKTPLTPMFEPNPASVIHYDKMKPNRSDLEGFVKSFWYIDYLTLIPSLLIACQQEDPLTALKAIPTMSSETIGKAMGIDYDLPTFQFYNVAQALIFNTKAKRVDSEGFKMKFDDLQNPLSTKSLLRDYIRKKYEDQYQSDLAIKARNERETISKTLVTMILGADSMDVVYALWKGGLTMGPVNHVISDSTKLGFADLKAKLMDLSQAVPLRLDKLRILLLGRDVHDNKIWNHGNVLMTKLAEIEPIFAQLGGLSMWDGIKDEYKKRRRHTYPRNKPNRSGHSNDKPSFYALGYLTLAEMINAVSEEEWEAYKAEHKNCCGINKRPHSQRWYRKQGLSIRDW